MIMCFRRAVTVTLNRERNGRRPRGSIAVSRTACVLLAGAAALLPFARADEAPRSGFVTDEDVKSIPDRPRPGYLEPFADPVFGTRVVRVSDPGGPIPNVGGSWGKVARHHYSLDQAWNADMSLLMLDRGTDGRGRLFLDGTTYKPLFLRKAPSTRDRWHPRRPELRIFVDGNTVGTWNVQSGRVSVIARIVRYSEFQFGPFEGNPSRDGDRIAIYATNPDGRKVAFVYDLRRGRKSTDLDLDGIAIDWVSVSPSGKYLVVHYDEDRTRVFDLGGRQVGPYWSEYGRPSHFDMTLDDDGEDIAVGVSKSPPDKGLVIKRRLRDGEVTVLTKGGFASHTSARNVRLPGWAFVSYGDSSKWPPYRSEIAAVRLDGSGAVRRLCHARRAGSDYLSEVHPSIAPDGRRVIWASNWGIDDGTVAAYVTELPAGED